MKCIGQVVHQDVMFSFPLDIDEYPLSRYVNIYFKVIASFLTQTRT